MLETVIIVCHVLTAIGVIGFVLIQQGKGADAGASFGGGASGTVFGSQGSANFLSRATAVLTAVFFVTSIALAYYAHRRAMPTSIFDTVPATQQVPAGSAPVTSTPTVNHEDLVAPAPAATNAVETTVTTEEPSAPAVTPAPAPASETTEAPKSE